MSGARILFLKSNVSGYTRRGKNGASVQVQPYTTSGGSGHSLPEVKPHPKARSSADFHGHVVPPKDLHDGAVGFVARNPHRSERLSLFHRDGRASNHFAQDEDAAAVAGHIEKHGLRMDERGHVFRKTEPPKP